MPYIVQEKRDALNPAIDQIITALRGLESDDPENVMEGNINYIFTKILDRVYSSPRYADINTVVGILGCVEREYYRRIVAPYENQKSFENGDVYENISALR